jgi:hypothetical protein
MYNPDEITYFADTDARNRRVRFGIKAEDRTRHVYVIGKTGMGKSVLLENMAVQDIRNGNGFCFMDPHGSAIETLLEYVPEERIKDVVYFAPFDVEHPISFNVMEDVGFDKRHLVLAGLMSTFKKIWVDAWSARMEYILGNTILALLEYPDSTLLDVNKMLTDKTFRKKVLNYITDPSVKSFWVDEFAKYTDRFAAEATPSISNKIGQFTGNPLIRNIIGQPKSSFDLRELMDNKKILLVNLSKGQIGEQNANLLGSMFITKIYLGALSRADAGDDALQQLPNFYLYVDEFQSFANDSFANILSEARKYKLNLTIAHQYIEQMSDEVRAAVFGNVGTMITFRVGSYDAEVLEKEFAPTFTAEDIVNLGAYQIYLRLMIDRIGSAPFSAATMPPLEKQEVDFVSQIIDSSRQQFAKPRAEVEELIKTTLNLGEDGSGSDSGGAGDRNSGRGNSRNSGNGNSGGSSRGNTRVKKFDSRSRTQKMDSSDANDYPKKKKNPVIDPQTKAELERLLHEDVKKESEKTSDTSEKTDVSESSESSSPKNSRKGDSNSVSNNSNKFQKEISLKEMTNNTQNNPEKRTKDNKGPSEKNTNSLKEALGSVLGNVNRNEGKDDDKDGGAKKESNKNDEPNSKKTVEASEPLKTTKPEIPEKELKDVLGLD